MWPVVPSMGQGQPVCGAVPSSLSVCLQQVTRICICICGGICGSVCRAKELVTCAGRATCAQVGVCMYPGMCVWAHVLRLCRGCSSQRSAEAAQHRLQTIIMFRYTCLYTYTHSLHALYKGQQIVIVSPGMTWQLAFGYGVARRWALLPLLNGFRKSKIK